MQWKSIKTSGILRITSEKKKNGNEQTNEWEQKKKKRNEKKWIEYWIYYKMETALFFLSLDQTFSDLIIINERIWTK